MPGDRRFDRPNYTQVPNELLDEVMPQVTSLAELKILLAVARRTFGFHQGEKLLSLTALEKLTGLSRSSVQAGVSAALERGYLARRKAGTAYVYGIRIGEGAQNLPSSDSGTAPIPDSGTASNKGKKHSPSGSKRKAAGAAFSPDPESDVDTAIVTCFEAWVQRTGRAADDTQLTVRRAGLIRSRLTEAGRGTPPAASREEKLAHAITELCEAAAGMGGSKWHRENGHLEFDQLFRARDRIESFRDRYRKDGGAEGEKRYSAYDDVVENAS